MTIVENGRQELTRRPSPRFSRPVRKPSKVLLVLAFGTVALVAVPTLFLLVEVFTAPDGKAFEALTRPRTFTLTWHTLALVAGTTVGTLLLGIPTAYVLTRTNLKGKRFWTVATTLPLAIPSYVAGLTWVTVLPLRGYWGSLFVLVLATTPYVTLPVAAALKRADAAVETVARTLGVSSFRAFLTMTIPQIAPAAGAGALLVALYTISEFGVVAIMRYSTLTPAVQTAFGGTFNRELAIVLSLVLVALALLIVLAERAVRRPVKTSRITVGPPKDLIQLSKKGHAFSWLGLGTVFALSVGVPIVALLERVSRSVAGNELEVGRMLQAAGVTIGLGFAGAAVAVLLALPISLLAARHRTTLISGLETTTFMGHGLPGIVLGLSMVYLSLSLLPGLYQTAWLLIIAYGILFVPKAMGSVRSAIAQVPVSLEDTARTLGRSPARTWFEVTGRLAWPGIAAGGMLVALTVMKELPATLMMRPIGMDTLATRLWQLSDIDAHGGAAPYAILLIAVSTVPALLLARDPERKM
ncbi:ABC transporter permease [Micrococcoides hystricis]|uniref:ABC transporter permease n=1 Tax=Micrococcoides hystricis TaxID=1572761 RepID=A0ABV6P9K4_9MICC